MMSFEKGSLSIHSENIFPIIKKWLYSDHDIFIRELVSNANDAITKLKQLSLMNEATIEDEPKFKITVTLDADAKTLTFSDNGIGMTDEEIKKYINQIAFSGAEDFINTYKDKSDKDQIIGHFGLGFYSAFMVASEVEIHSLSYKENAEPVIWKCDGGKEFEMTLGDKTSRGTDIVLHISEEGTDFLNEYTLKQTLEKYCSFMPVEIYLDVLGKEPEKDEEGTVIAPEPINTTLPLYAKNPSDCTDEEYIEFYQQTFKDFKKPLFWIHLNMDYPFNLKGILYFPKLNTEFDRIEGQIKLYNSQVFVADNIKEVIPEFLLLLKGVIDCPDLPLNVSRSFLQNDGFVRKISNYITKKVGDKLNGLYKTEREDYDNFWDDIHQFIKFGALKDEKFYDNVKDIFIYKDLEGKHISLDEYLADAIGKHENKVFYVTDPNTQSQYINLFKSNDMNALILDHPIDSAFISLIESKNEAVKFARVDSDLSEEMIDNDSEKIDEAKQTEMENHFKSILDKEKLKVRIENLKSDDMSSMIVLSEESRRMQDMMKMYQMPGMDLNQFEGETTLVLNQKHPLVQHLIHQESSDQVSDLDKMIYEQLYDLALMSHTQMEPSTLTQFIKRTNELMLKLL